MPVITMRIPANGATRLSTQTWLEGEVWRRFGGEPSIRKAIEKLVSEATTEQMGDSDFVKIMKEVRSEGIEGNKR